MNIAYQTARILVLLFALLFLVMGMQWMFVPQNMIGDVSLLPVGIPGLAILRADLGSFFLVAGITAALGASGIRNANGYLFCSGLLIGFAAIGRLAGFALDGIVEESFTPFIIELVIITLYVGLAAARGRIEKKTADT